MAIALAGLVLGAIRFDATTCLLCISLALWVLVSWALFLIRLRFELPTLQCQRVLNDRISSDTVAWVDRRLKVTVRVQSRTKIRGVTYFRDVIPEIFALQIQSTEARKNVKSPAAEPISKRKRGVFITWYQALVGLGDQAKQWFTQDAYQPRFARLPSEHESSTAGSDFTWTYHLRPRAAGHAVLPGCRITRSDRFGFFEAHYFVSSEQKIRILPDYHRQGERSPIAKRHNSIPRHGIHRLQRSGFGSELLELREYQPGDPPKAIAWKASARRESLMTRQYESEVPVRVRIFVDGSHSTRLGGFGMRLIDQFNHVAASIAQSATNVGDPIALTLADESRTRSLRFQSGDKGQMKLLEALADFSNAPPPPADWISTSAVQATQKVINERFPGLLDKRYSRIPFAFLQKTRERYRVSQALGVIFDLTPMETYRCYFNDLDFSKQARRLLHECGTPWLPPLLAALPSQDPRAHLNMEILGQAVSKELTVAKDNEVFVILADAINCGQNLHKLIRPLKLALAKHHRVLFVCPSTTMVRPKQSVVRAKSYETTELLHAAETIRARNATAQLKRDLGRLGIPIGMSGSKDSIRMVLDEIETARDGRKRGLATR